MPVPPCPLTPWFGSPSSSSSLVADSRHGTTSSDSMARAMWYACSVTRAVEAWRRRACSAARWSVAVTGVGAGCGGGGRECELPPPWKLPWKLPCALPGPAGPPWDGAGWTCCCICDAADLAAYDWLDPGMAVRDGAGACSRCCWPYCGCWYC